MIMRVWRGFRTAGWSRDEARAAALQPETHTLRLYDFATRVWKALADSVTGDDVNWSEDSRHVYVDSPQGRIPLSSGFA
jgi:hypothetical protein